jgi:hypothetical protein
MRSFERFNFIKLDACLLLQSLNRTWPNEEFLRSIMTVFGLPKEFLVYASSQGTSVE